MKNILKDFKSFAVRGNVIDMAVGIIIGAAFSKIVTSLVNDILMPPLGWVISGIDFTNMSLTLGETIEGIDPVVIKYGHFIQVTIDFLLTAVAIFAVIKVINHWNKEKDKEQNPKAPEISKQEQTLIEIRDILKENSKKQV